MRKIIFYKSPNGSKPVKAFLDSLTDKQSKKVAWVLSLVRDLNFVPKEYLKKLVNTNDIWEIRIRSSNIIFRILCFFDKGNIIILTNGFAKKTQKTPAKADDIRLSTLKNYLEALNRKLQINII